MANWWDAPSDESAVAESAPTLLDTATLEQQARHAQLAELLRPTPTSAEPSILSTLDSYRQAKAAAANPQPGTVAPAAQAQPDKPFFDLGNTAGALWEGATQQLWPAIKATAAQAYTGLDRPDQAPEWAKQALAENRQVQEQQQAKTAQLQREGKSDSVSESIREAIPSLPFSVGSLAAGLAAAAPVVAMGGGLTAPAGIAAGMAGSAAAAYRLAGSQYLNDAFAELEKSSQEQRGRGLDDGEKQKAYEVLRPLAEKAGYWEAGPEAIGNAATMGLGRIALGFVGKGAMQKIAGNALQRAGVRVAAGLGNVATELGTETVTQVGQGVPQGQANALVTAMREGKPLDEALAAAQSAKSDYEGVEGVVQAFKDVAPATLATLGLMGAGAKAAHWAYQPIAERAEARAAGRSAAQHLDQLSLAGLSDADLDTTIQQTQHVIATPKLPPALRDRLTEAVGRLNSDQQARANGDALRQAFGDYAAATAPEALVDLPADEQSRVLQEAAFGTLFAPRTRNTLVGMSAPDKLNQLNDAEMAQAGQAAVDAATVLARANQPELEPEIRSLLDAARTYSGELHQRRSAADLASEVTGPDGADRARALLDSVTRINGNAQQFLSPEYQRATLADDQLPRLLERGQTLLRLDADPAVPFNLAAPQRAALTTALGHLRAEQANRQTEGWPQRNQTLSQVENPKVKEVEAALTRKDVSTWLNAKSRGPQWLPALQGALDQADARIAYRQQTGATEADDYQRLVANRALLRQKIETLTAQLAQTRDQAVREGKDWRFPDEQSGIKKPAKEWTDDQGRQWTRDALDQPMPVDEAVMDSGIAPPPPATAPTLTAPATRPALFAPAAPLRLAGPPPVPPDYVPSTARPESAVPENYNPLAPRSAPLGQLGNMPLGAEDAQALTALRSIPEPQRTAAQNLRLFRLERTVSGVLGTPATAAPQPQPIAPPVTAAPSPADLLARAANQGVVPPALTGAQGPLSVPQPGVTPNASPVRINPQLPSQGSQEGQPEVQPGSVESGGDFRWGRQDQAGTPPAGQGAEGEVAPLSVAQSATPQQDAVKARQLTEQAITNPDLFPAIERLPEQPLENLRAVQQRLDTWLERFGDTGALVQVNGATERSIIPWRNTDLVNRYQQAVTAVLDTAESTARSASTPRIPAPAPELSPAQQRHQTLLDQRTAELDELKSGIQARRRAISVLANARLAAGEAKEAIQQELEPTFNEGKQYLQWLERHGWTATDGRGPVNPSFLGAQLTPIPDDLRAYAAPVSADNPLIPSSTPPENRDAQERQAEAEALLKQEAKEKEALILQRLQDDEKWVGRTVEFVRNEYPVRAVVLRVENGRAYVRDGDVGTSVPLEQLTLSASQDVIPLRGVGEAALREAADSFRPGSRYFYIAEELTAQLEGDNPKISTEALMALRAMPAQELWSLLQTINQQVPDVSSSGDIRRAASRLIAETLMKQETPPPEAGGATDLTAPFEAMIDERGNVTRGGDVINTLLKPLSDADLTTIKEWARKRSPQAARWIGDNAVAEQRARINAAQTDQAPADRWNATDQATREQWIRDTGASADFAQRKAGEWGTWAQIPEGRAKTDLTALLNQAPATQPPGETAPTADETALQVGQVYRNFDLLFQGENQDRHVARAEIVKIENGQVVISASIKGVKGKREIPINAVDFAGLVARLQQRDNEQVKPLPDQTPQFDVAPDAELTPFKVTYPLYPELLIYPANPIHTGINEEQKVLAYHYFRLRRKVPKAEQQRFGIDPIADEHYRIAILQYPNGETGSIVEYPYTYQMGANAAGQAAVIFWFRRLPDDTDAIPALRPVWNAARDLWEQAQKRLPTESVTPSPTPESPNELNEANREPSTEAGSAPGVRPGQGAGRRLALSAPRSPRRTVEALADAGRIVTIDEDAGLIEAVEEQVDPEDPSLIFTRLSVNRDRAQQLLVERDAALGLRFPGLEPGRLAEDLQIVPTYREAADPQRAADTETDDTADGNWRVSLAGEPERAHSVLIRAVRVDDIESQDQTLYAPAGPVYLGRGKNERDLESLVLYRVGEDATLYDFLDAIEQANARLVVRASAERNQATLDRYFTTADTRAPVWVVKDADGVVVDWSISREGLQRRQSDTGATLERMTKQDWQSRPQDTPIFEDIAQALERFGADDGTLETARQQVAGLKAELALWQKSRAEIPEYMPNGRYHVGVQKGIVELEKRLAEAQDTLAEITLQTPLVAPDGYQFRAEKKKGGRWYKFYSQAPNDREWKPMDGSVSGLDPQNALAYLQGIIQQEHQGAAVAPAPTAEPAPTPALTLLQKAAIKVISEQYYGDAWRLAGPHNKELRRDLYQNLLDGTGQKATIANSGVGAIRDRLVELAGISKEGKAIAEWENELTDWMKNVLAAKEPVPAPRPAPTPAPAEPAQVDKTLDAAALSKLIRNAGMQPTSVAKEAYADDGRLVVIRYDAQLAPETVSAHIQRIHTLVQDIAPRFDANAIVLRRNQSLVFIVAGHRGIAPKSDLTVGIKRPEYFAQQPAPAESVAQESPLGPLDEALVQRWEATLKGQRREKDPQAVIAAAQKQLQEQITGWNTVRAESDKALQDAGTRPDGKPRQVANAALMKRSKNLADQADKLFQEIQDTRAFIAATERRYGLTQQPAPAPAEPVATNSLTKQDWLKARDKALKADKLKLSSLSWDQVRHIPVIEMGRVDGVPTEYWRDVEITPEERDALGVTVLQTLVRGKDALGKPSDEAALRSAGREAVRILKRRSPPIADIVQQVGQRDGRLDEVFADGHWYGFREIQAAAKAAGFEESREGVAQWVDRFRPQPVKVTTQDELREVLLTGKGKEVSDKAELPNGTVLQLRWTDYGWTLNVRQPGGGTITAGGTGVNPWSFTEAFQHAKEEARLPESAPIPAPAPAPLTAAQQQQVTAVEELLFDQLLSQAPMRHMLANDTNSLMVEVDLVRQEIGTLLAQWTAKQFDKNPNAAIGPIVNRINEDWQNGDYAERMTRQLIARAKTMRTTEAAPPSVPAPAPTTIATPIGPAKARPAGPGVTAIELPVGAATPAPTPAAPPARPADYGKGNTIFTEDAAAKARELLKRKLGQLNAGLDPELIQAGITLAGYHMEAGARAFADYAKAMISDLGEAARPFLRSFYEGVRHYPGFDKTGLTRSNDLDYSEKWEIWPGDTFRIKGQNKTVAWLNEHRVYFEDGTEVSAINLASAKPDWELVARVGAMPQEAALVTETPAATPDLEETPEAPTPEFAAGGRRLAESVKTFLLDESGPLSANQLWSIADTAFGGTQAEGRYNSKDAYDAMELGLNQAVLDSTEAPLRGTTPEQMQEALAYLERLQQRLPTQTRRDAEQQQMQQFSTPHLHSHVVAWVAHIQPTDVVLEPTAGTGNLVTHAKLANPAAIFANELSERRDALLRQIPGVQVFNENANHLHAILPARIQPSVVVMNPPFSADVNLPGQKKLDVGALHIEQALQRLQPGGRLVAIVGRGMAMDAPRFSDWWKKIEKQYNVRANIAISGREYTKFGTSFDNRILVIDKNGQTGIRSKIIGGEVERVADLIPLLKGVRDERTLPTQSTPVVAAGQAGAAGAAPKPGTGPAVSPATGGVRGRPARPVPNAQGRPGRPEGGAGAADGRAPGQRVEDTDHTRPGQRRPAQPTGTRPKSAGPGGVVGGNATPGPASTSDSTQPNAPLTLEAREQGAVPPLDAQGLGISRFDPYRPQVTIQGAQPHPTPLVESAAMASVSFPPLTYLPTLPSALVTSGRLSAAQLETISYAGQAHAQLLPNSERRGFYIGDGTGVGKGAQVAGILLDNWNQGRKKAVWVSENVRLLDDARRDAEWVGLGKERILFQGDLKGPITLPEGVLFTTYKTLTAGEKDTKGQPGLQRIDQLVNWLGADFEGVIAFDEAHNMSNLKPQQGPMGQASGSKTASFGVELQRRLPKARIVYVSATGATEIANLAYAERLGLWGEGTAFSDRDTFLSAIENGGLAAMEVVAKDLKAMGLYTARSLSYDGVDVEMLNHLLTPEQVTMYDTLATTWQGVLANVEHAMVAANSKQNADARKRALSAFWGAHQRFFNSVLTSLSVPSLLKDVEAELQANHSIVMQLVNTNEATQERRMAQAAEAGQELEDIDLSPRDVLMQYVQNSFPTTLYEEYLDDEGNRQTRPVFDSAGNAVQDPLAVAMRDDLLIRLATLSVPEGVLEQVINHFGSDAVAEITMRKRRLVRQKDGSVVEEKLSAAKRKLDAQAFDDGKKRILIFSYAGGTGRSYHADLRYLNQQRRVHYLVQPGWRADKAIQGLGRTHRTNQAQPPLVKPITTELKAQRRFISSIARRMDQMGAITRGQRDANTQGLFDEDANLENQYSQAALFNLFLDIAHGQESTITIAEVEKQMGITLLDRDGNLVLKKIPTIQQFLNRLLSLEIPMMDRVFDAFDRRRRNLIEYAKQTGTYDTGMETLVADSLIKLDDQLAVDHAFGTPTRYLKLEATHPNRIITFKELQSNGAPLFYARNRKSGRLYAFLEAGVTRTDTNTGAQIPQVIRQSPIDRRYFDRREITKENYEEIKFATPSEARAAWEQAMAEAPQFYKETLHLLTGALLPIWDRLPQDTTRVIRAQTDTGERLLGRVLPNKDVNETLRRLGVGVTAPKLTGQQALDALLNEGATLVLANDWRLAPRTVNQRTRIEVLMPPGAGGLDTADRNLLESMGGFSEMIAWNYRTFLPTDQPAVLERLIASKPIIEVLEPGQTPSAPARPTAPAAAPPAPTTPPQRFAIAATPASVRASLEAIAGDQIVQDLIDAGSLVLVATQQDAVRRSQGRIQIPPGQRVGGAVDPETGTVYLIAEHIRPEDVAGLLRHEVAVHQRRLGLDQPKPRALRLAMALLRLTPARQWMGETTFAGVLDQMERMRKAGNVRVVAAFEHALKAMKALKQDVNNPQLVAEEALAYLVGDQANADLPLFRRILAAVRTFLTRAGFKLDLTTDDLVMLAQSALETAAQREVRAGAITKGVLGRNEEDAEAARQYAEVVARYTNPDGSKKDGWMKAPNGQPTKLNERQWVQVRTPNTGAFSPVNPDIRYAYAGERAATGQYGVPWPTDFPNITPLSTIAKLKAHPEYLAAKTGDRAAAVRVISAIMQRDQQTKLRALAARYPDAIVVPVHAVERNGTNKIPRTFADFISELTGLSVDTSIVQTNKVGRTSQNTWHRLAFRPQFDGDVRPGARYLLVDDAVTGGGTFSELRQFIEGRGGRVVHLAAIGAAQFSAKIALSESTYQTLEARYGAENLERFLRDHSLYGGNPRALTESEARTLLGAGTLDAAGDRITAAIEQERLRSQSPGVQGAVAETTPDTVTPPSGGPQRFAIAIAPGTPPQMTLPPMTRIEVLRRAIQDRFLRFKTLQDWLKKTGINLTPDADVYGEEERSVKRFAAQAQDFRDQTLTPLVQAAGQAGYAVTGGDFIAALMDGQPLPARFKPSIPEYLIAQHAAERNRAIAKINPRYADPDQPGSGLTDAEAATILARYRALPHFAAFERMAEQFRAIAEGTKNLLLDAGILNAETVAAWDAAYQHYVPLKGGPDDAPAKQGTGPGNSVVARQRRAMGHDLRAENVLENIFRDRERALFNIEKNKVGQALKQFVEQANNPAIGTVGQPEKHATLIQGWLHEVWIEGRPLGAYQSYNDAKAAIAADSAATGRPVAQYGVRHKAVDPSVVYMTRPLLAENEAGVYINGELVRIQLNDEAAARAYNALGVDGAGGLLKVARSFNTFLSKAYTGYNPEFLLVNMARDLTAGTINLTGKYGAGFAAQALKHYVGSFREAWRFARDKGEHAWLDRYRTAGGSTGASYLSDLERLGGDIERTFEDAQGAVATWKAGKPGAAARVLSADVVRKVFGLIEAFNQAGENALRIATFRTVIEQGGTEAEAASAAANVTVNFNRRGEMTYPLGALYLFFNPNVQGTQILLDTLLNSPHKRQAQAAAAGLVGLAFLLANLARGGDDEDEERWRRIPGYTKDRNLILQLGEKQVTVPLPYGYGMFWALGNVLSDLAHGADDGKAGVRLASALFEHFSPLGNPLLGETADIKNLAELMPTLLRMPTDIMINRGGMGAPIMPEVMPWNPGQPDSARRWRETTGKLADKVTTGLNQLTGGSPYESGYLDMSPETIKYLWRGLTGGAGQFVSDTFGLGMTLAQGATPELRETPGLRKFVRVETVQNARTLFSDQANQIREAVGAFNAAKRAQDAAGMADLVQDKAALIRLGSVLNQFQELIKTRRQLHDLIQATDMPLPQKRLQLKTIEQEETRLYGLFSKIFRKPVH